MDKVLRILGLQRGMSLLQTVVQLVRIIQAVASAVQHLQHQLDNPLSQAGTVSKPEPVDLPNDLAAPVDLNAVQRELNNLEADALKNL